MTKSVLTAVCNRGYQKMPTLCGWTSNRQNEIINADCGFLCRRCRHAYVWACCIWGPFIFVPCIWVFCLPWESGLPLFLQIFHWCLSSESRYKGFCSRLFFIIDNNTFWLQKKSTLYFQCQFFLPSKWFISVKKILVQLKHKITQECIPVGCVPPACWPYPSMHWVGEGVYPSTHWAGGVSDWGVSVQGGICLGCLTGGCLPRGYLPRRVSAKGVSAKGVSARGVSAWGWQTPPVNRMTDKQV